MDENGLEKTESPEMCEEARALRTKHFDINDKNGHPGIEAHQYLSTIVEHFIRSL